jgi:hypothetical protein
MYKDIVEAHKHGSHHREELLSSDQCGCFYCCAIYSPDDVKDWVDEDSKDIGQTALCVHCGIDSVIGSASGFPITKAFLEAMHQHWFSPTPK